MPLEAVIFDLDGVVTDTAQAHIRSWQELFDEYLRQREKKYGEPFVPFDPEKDYLNFVDGRPRYQGVQSFLNARHIELPFGTPEDPPEKETVCGLGNKKNRLFQDIIRREGAKVFSSTLKWIETLKGRHTKVGMATSSKNGPLVLDVTGLADLFEATVDGNDAARLGLKGKPNPDIFLECASRLGVEPGRSAVVEDALSGVRAAKSGGFGAVIGMARTNTPAALRENGADVAVEDLTEISPAQLDTLLEKGRKQPS